MPSDLSSLCSLARAEDTTSAHTIESREEAYKVLSLAHMSSFAPLPAARSGKSRTYLLKRLGPKIVPCGTPRVTGRRDDVPVVESI